MLEAWRVADNDGNVDSIDVNCNIHFNYFCGKQVYGAVTASSREILKSKRAFQ
jgi:hypothetical protein